MRRTIFALALLLSPLTAAAAEPAASAVCVEATVGGTHFLGSGTVVASEDGRSLVLTNRHVIESGGAVRVWHADRWYSGCSLAAVAKSADLALVAVPAVLPAAAIADEAPAPGSPITFHGYGPVMDRKLPLARAGVVSENRYVEPTITGSAASVSGDSGSGIFNESGELVGVVWGGGPNGAPGMTGVPLASVTVFLVEVRPALFPRLRAAMGRLAGALAPKPEKAPPPKAAPKDGKAPAAAPKEATPPPPVPKTPPVAAAPQAAPACSGGRCAPAYRWAPLGGLFRR